MPSVRFIIITFLMTSLSPLLSTLSGQEVINSPDDSVLPSPSPVKNQEERKSSWTFSSDLVSSYIWRGMKQGEGPHLQPGVEYSHGRFTGGIWGTFDLHGYREVDLYLAMELPAGFKISLQDYWMADMPWHDFSGASGSHVLEAGTGYESEYISLTVNYIFNEAGGAGSIGGDIYAECRMFFDYFTVFMGAGNGWHTSDGQFGACNLGLEVSYDIKIKNRFILPVTASMVYNPDSARLHFMATVSFSTGSGD